MIRTIRSKVLALVVLALIAAACSAPGGEAEVSGEDVGAGGASAAPDAGSEAAEPVSGDAIKIGFLAATTGQLAASGQDMVRGWDLYWKENGDTVAGRQVATLHEDTAGDPQVGLNKARRLVENEQVGLVVGPLLANVGYAVAEYLGEQGVPNFQQVSSADDLTQRGPIDGVLRVGGWTSSQTAHPVGEWAYEQGYRKAVTICSDYAFGQEYCGGFVNTFTDAGGEIVDQLWNPLGTQDFGTYMAQIEQADADVVFALEVGGDSVRFVEAWNSFGLKDSDLQLIGGETLLDQSLLRNMGDEAEGLMSVGKFAEGREEGLTPDFVEAFDAEYGDLPSYYASVSYSAAQWTAQALEEVDGDIEDTEAFLDAVRSIELDTPGGPMSLDDHDNPDQNVYIREVQRRDDDRLWNVPTETFEDVSQFWTYDPEEFLDHPVYSRDYQGDGVWPDPEQ